MAWTALYYSMRVNASDERLSFKLMRDISNNYALQGSLKCHIKGFFIIFNFSLKIFIKNMFKEIVRFVRILVMHSIYIYLLDCLKFENPNTIIVIFFNFIKYPQI